MTTTHNHAGHLCVLVHGFWGGPAHLENMASLLRLKHPQENLHILIAKRNAGPFTYDGIELGGERVCLEIEEEVEKLAQAGHKITRFSIVGYSLGGLISRYAIGLLESKGFFENIKPVTFTTFATPHLGVRTPLRGFHNHLWNFVGARTLSVSGTQLFAIDKFRVTQRPLLDILCDPGSSFLSALAKFERRILYSNIVNDHHASFYTTSISKSDPFTTLEGLEIKYLKGYDNIVLDSDLPISRKELHIAHSSNMGKLMYGCRRFVATLPFVLAMIIIVPIRTVGFFIHSGIQTIRSRRRIRLHERGLAGIQPGNYRLPMLLADVREVVEDVYENLNHAQNNEYLDESEEEELNGRDDSDEKRVLQTTSRSTMATSEKTSRWMEGSPTLALAPVQFRMLHALNSVGFRKHFVHIHKDHHAHAAIIYRAHKPGYEEGKVVIRHWLDEEFII